MTKYIYTGPAADYPTLGFSVAGTGAILDGAASSPVVASPPDARWAVYGGGDAESVTRYSSGVGATPTAEPADGSILAYSDAANAFVPTDPSELGGGASDDAIAALVADDASDTRAALDVLIGEGGGSGAGLPSTIVNRTTAYTAAAGEFVRGDTTAGGFTVTLPTAPAVGALVAVQKTDATGNVLTAAPAGGGTINGDATAAIVARYAGAVLEHLGSNAWTVVSTFSTTGPKGDTGAQGPVGTGGISPWQAVAGTVGRWYSANPMSGGSLTNQSIALNRGHMGMPVIAQRNITMDQLGVNVATAGGAGALIRMAVYAWINQADPYGLTLNTALATLLVDTGTTPTSGAATSTGRVKFTLASPLVIPQGTAFGIAVAVQGAGGAVTISCENPNMQALPWGSDDIFNGNPAAVIRTDISGAWPATFTPTAYAANGVGGAGNYRRSA